jgi:hypothetical protein
MMSAVQLRVGRVLSGLLVLVLGPALLPVSAAFAASVDRARLGTARSSTTLSGFDAARASTQVGGAVWDAVRVFPGAARTVTVQYRALGAARFIDDSSGVTSARGLFIARLQPRSAGVWQFRLVVLATSRDNGVVSAIRIVAASGRAATTSVQGFDSSPVTTESGHSVVDLVTVLPKAHRAVSVQARRPGARRFVTVATGSFSSDGAFRAVYRPTDAGVWAYRLVVRASTTARTGISATRIVTVTRLTPTPTPTPTPRPTPRPTPTPTPTPGPADTAPGPVTGLTVVSTTSSSINLSWTNPADPDFAGVQIRRAVGTTPPASPTGGTQVARTGANTTSYADIGLAPNIKFAYALFAFDTAGNFSSRAIGSTTTGAPTIAVLSINGSTGPTAKQTQGVSEVFVLGGSPGLGLSLLAGTLDYGDGQSKTFTGGDPAFWIPDPHAYTSPGSFTAVWRVTDSAFGTDSTSIDVTVFKDGPTATISEAVPGSAKVGSPVTFDVTTSTPIGTSFRSYDFSSFIGVDPATQVATYATDSVFAAAGQPPTQLTLIFDTPGSYEVDLVIDNDAGGEAFVTTNVNVALL